MQKIFGLIKSILLRTADDVVSPLYDGITLVGPYAISITLLLSIFWGIFLGAKYAKAEDAAEKENLHKVLVNFLIGAFAVICLIAVVYAIREPLCKWIDG